MPERTFSKDQINDLLRRAAELQITTDDEEVGLTFSELEQIAAESGIPPRFLTAALMEADHGPKNRDVSGHTTTHVFVEKVIPGQLDEDEWGSVVYRLREKYTSEDGDGLGMGALYGRGVTESLGSIRDWRHTSTLGVKSALSIRSSDGSQHVSFQRRVGLGSPRAEGIGYGFVLALLAGMLAGGVAESVWILILVLAAVWAIAAPTVEALDRRWRGKILREMQGTVGEIDELIRDEELAEAAATDSIAQEPLLDIPDAGEADTPLGKRPRDRA